MTLPTLRIVGGIDDETVYSGLTPEVVEAFASAAADVRALIARLEALPAQHDAHSRVCEVRTALEEALTVLEYEHEPGDFAGILPPGEEVRP